MFKHILHSVLTYVDYYWIAGLEFYQFWYPNFNVIEFSKISCFYFSFLFQFFSPKSCLFLNHFTRNNFLEILLNIFTHISYLFKKIQNFSKVTLSIHQQLGKPIRGDGKMKGYFPGWYQIWLKSLEPQCSLVLALAAG